MERRRVYRRLAIVSSALSVLLASQVPGRFFVCFIRFCASGPPPGRSEAQVQLGVSLGPILGRFWGPFGVHIGVRLEPFLDQSVTKDGLKAIRLTSWRHETSVYMKIDKRMLDNMHSATLESSNQRTNIHLGAFGTGVGGSAVEFSSIWGCV